MGGKIHVKVMKYTGALLFLSYVLANASEYQVKLETDSNTSNTKISGVNWKKETQEPTLQLRMFTQIDQSPYYVLLHGKYFGHDSGSLIFEQASSLVPHFAAVTKKLSFQSDGSFEVEVQIEGEQTEFTLTEVDASGKTQVQKDKILFPEWESFKKNLTLSKKLHFYAGLSFSGTTYSQTDSASGTTNNFSELGINVQAQGHYQWKEFLAFRAEALFTVLPIGFGESGNTIRFLNLDAQAIYPLKFVHSPWRLELLGNYSYRTTIPSSGSFGYFNVHGVTLYPRLEKEFSGGKSAFLEVKYLPLLNGSGSFSFLPSGNDEFTIKAGYQGFEIKRHVLELTFDAKLFALTYTGGSTGSIQANSYTLGANYFF